VITVVTAVRNAVSSIDDCLDSVARQDLPNVEHLVLDGDSSDGTTERIRARRDVHVCHIRQADGGIYDALNKGVRLARHDIIGFLHADDTFAGPRTLSRIADLFCAHPEVDGVYGDLVYVRARQPAHIVRYWRAGKYEHGCFERGWMPPHPTLFLRRSVYERVGLYRTDLRIAADYEFTLRALHLSRVAVCYLPEVITRMRLGGVSNKSIANVLQKTREDLRAWTLNQLPHRAVPAVFLKNVRKLPQFFVRPH
jgi:glycosyltransferase involved in cell wall biosynthesis